MNQHKQLINKAESLSKEYKIPLWIVINILSEGVAGANAYIAEIHTVKPARKITFPPKEF